MSGTATSKDHTLDTLVLTFAAFLYHSKGAGTKYPPIPGMRDTCDPSKDEVPGPKCQQSSHNTVRERKGDSINPMQTDTECKRMEQQKFPRHALQ